MRKYLFALLMIPALTLGQGVIETIDAPDTNISGLGWGNGHLWAVDETTDYVYEVNPETGDVISSFYCEHDASFHPTGLSFGQDIVYVALWNGGTSAYVYKYQVDGTFISSIYLCGG